MLLGPGPHNAKRFGQRFVATAASNAFGKRGTNRHSGRVFATVFILLLGVVNFALHKAVIESRHPLLGQVPWFVHLLGGRISMAAEFLLLLGALLLSAEGFSPWGWAYLLYSIFNGIAAWLILSGRI